MLRSYFGMAFPLGLSCGTSLGGILVDFVGWRWYVDVPAYYNLTFFDMHYPGPSSYKSHSAYSAFLLPHGDYQHQMIAQTKRKMDSTILSTVNLICSVYSHWEYLSPHLRYCAIPSKEERVLQWLLLP